MSETIADKLQTISENVPKVYESGIEQGQQAEYDKFWDSYQNYGNLTNYQNVFGGAGWKDGNFKPKYTPNIKAAALMFRETGIKNIVGLDFSNANDFQYAFYYSKVEYIDEISTISASRLYQTFDGCANLKTIGKLILKEDGSQTLTGPFNRCSSLENIGIEGVIGQTINFSASPLTVASMKSIITALKNYAGTTSEYTNRLTFSSTCWAKLEADSTAPNGETWEDYVTSLGWEYA